MTWRRNEVTHCYCIKPFNPEHTDLNTRNIDFLTISMTGLSNQSKYTKGAKTSNNYCGFDLKSKFHIETITATIHFEQYFPITSDIVLAL